MSPRKPRTAPIGTGPLDVPPTDMAGDAAPLINHRGHEIPPGVLAIVTVDDTTDGYYTEILHPLAGVTTRSWFTVPFYYCLPLVIGNQSGFVFKSTRDFDATWAGGDAPATIMWIDDDLPKKQEVTTQFNHGIISIQNQFWIKTAPGISVMTIQPPNAYIHGLVAMTGVVETDNIRRDFTLNLRITQPGIVVSVRKGDFLSGLVPIRRHETEGYALRLASEVVGASALAGEREEAGRLSTERTVRDYLPAYGRPGPGRRYARGEHTTGEMYVDHQRTIPKPAHDRT